MAEAAAAIGLVASIASLVELTIEVFSRLHDFTSKSSEVPESLRSLSIRLPLLTATLKHIQSQAECGRFSDDIALSKVLPSDGASKLERALKALKSLAKEDEVKRALGKIDGNNDILVLHHTTQHVDTGDRILEALSKLSVTTPAPPCPSSTIPFPRDPDFVDRGAIVDQLCQKCALPASRTALVGLGGVGKSQLAIELGYRIREQSPGTWVLWIHAGSTARLEQSFRDIADYIEIPGRDDPKANVFRLVHDWLRGGKSGQWLLILDNVDNPDILDAGGNSLGGQGTSARSELRQPISTYFPQSKNGSILVTSRSQAAALKLVEEKDIVAVQPMTLSHALALFEKKLGPLIPGDSGAELVEALEFMPLAIVQAAAYISQRAPRYSVERYLEDFRKSDSKKTSLLNYEGGQLRRDWQAKNSILITWQISFEHIRETWPSAADLLSLMSFFDRQGIPEAVVRKRPERGYGRGSHEGRGEYNCREDDEGDNDDVSDSSEHDGFEDSVQILRSYSFLSVAIDGTFEMHALVQLATRKWLEANRKLEYWRQCFIKNLSAEFPTGDYENWTHCQALYPHVKSANMQRPKAEESLKLWASILYRAAWYMWRRGAMIEATNLSEVAMKMGRQILGQEHEETLCYMDMVGVVYLTGGRWKEAEKLKVQVIETRKRVLGEERRSTLNSMATLASIYLRQGRWKEAEQLNIQVIETQKKVLGEEHPDTLMSIGNLAITYGNQERWKEAEELNLQVIEIEKRVLDEEHPDTLVSIGNLALIYLHQGRWKEAEELDLQVIEIKKRVLGEEHPNTLTTIGNLALLYGDQGRWKEAEELNSYVMETKKRVLGEEHPSTLISIGNLAFTLKSQSRYKEAISLIEHYSESQKRILGPEHPKTKHSLECLREWKIEADEHEHSD